MTAGFASKSVIWYFLIVPMSSGPWDVALELHPGGDLVGDIASGTVSQAMVFLKNNIQLCTLEFDGFNYY